MISNRRKLRAVVDGSGLTPEQVARQVGVTRPALLYWMSGRSEPTMEHAVALAIWSGGDVPADRWPKHAAAAKRLSSMVPLSSRENCSRGRGQRKPERLRSKETSR